MMILGHAFQASKRPAAEVDDFCGGETRSKFVPLTALQRRFNDSVLLMLVYCAFCHSHSAPCRLTRTSGGQAAFTLMLVLKMEGWSVVGSDTKGSVFRPNRTHL